MDPNSLVWVLWFALHGGGSAATCCATQGQISVPSIPVPSGEKELSAYEVCRAIGDANKNAAFNVQCMAKPQ